MMQIFNYWPEAICLIALGLGYLLLLGKSSWGKIILSLNLAFLLLLILYGSLGSARPIFFHFQSFTGDLIAYQVVEKKAIYVWMRVDSSPSPIYFKLPWDISVAKDMDFYTGENSSRGDGAGHLRITINPGADKQATIELREIPEEVQKK